MRATPWSPDGSDNAFDIEAGMERPAEVAPRDPGEVLMDNKSCEDLPSQSKLQAVGSQRRLSRVPVSGNWRQQAHSEACRKMIEGLLKGDSTGAPRPAAADERINRAVADAVERHAAKDPGVRHTEEGQCHLSSRVGIPKARREQCRTPELVGVRQQKKDHNDERTT